MTQTARIFPAGILHKGICVSCFAHPMEYIQLLIMIKDRCQETADDSLIDITKPRLFKYIENFTTKKWKFSDKKIWYFSYICS